MKEEEIQEAYREIIKAQQSTIDSLTASGTKIGTIKASVGEQTFQYDVAFGIGLTIVTAAASDITVSYR